MNYDWHGLVRDRSELETIACLLAEEAMKSNENVVSRYRRVIYNSISFINGQPTIYLYSTCNINKENMGNGIYTTDNVDDLHPDNFGEVTVSRDINEHRFKFHPKDVPLPAEEEFFIESIPTDIDFYDAELKEFTKKYRNVKLERMFSIEQQVIVNSRGGKVIQTIPYFGIFYNHGYDPIPTSRSITVVCTSDNDIRRLPVMVKYMPDPTPDRRIKEAPTFTEAFGELYRISGLKYGGLEEAGIPLSELYDIVMLTGVPVHEIFGHHFEEPIRYLNYGESGTFKHGQNIQNKGIILRDDPMQTVDGFRVQGFTNIDAYGRRREPRTHIKDGKVIEFLGSEYADPENLKRFINVEKSDFVGNASQYTDGLFPQPRMSCTVIDGPTQDIDLEGKLVLVPHTGHTDSQEKTYEVRSQEVYVIRNGMPERLIPVQVTGGINQALANIVLLRNESYQIGLCGKPDPIHDNKKQQVLVSQFGKNQLWEAQQVYPLPISDIHLKILTE